MDFLKKTLSPPMSAMEKNSDLSLSTDMVGNDFFHAFIIECMGYKVTNEFVLGCSTAV